MRYIAPEFRIGMKRAIWERNMAIFLFVLVLIIFSFAERDSRKLEKLYTNVAHAGNEMMAKEGGLTPAQNFNLIRPRVTAF
jgi:hypothetical protein